MYLLIVVVGGGEENSVLKRVEEEEEAKEVEYETEGEGEQGACSPDEVLPY